MSLKSDQLKILLSVNGHRCKKNLLHANNKGVDQAARMCSLSAFIIHFMKNIVAILALSGIFKILASHCS